MAASAGSAQNPQAQDESALSFKQIFDIELQEISELRQRRARAAGEDSTHKPTPEEVRKSLIGLSFSGGGIRSATFNLGVLQALAKLNLLSKFDYLSTVSGGGYIGSWLSAWIKRFGLKTVLKELQPLASEAPAGSAYREPHAIRFLREYSNYLTPRMGFFSTDTWAAIATYLRNLILNQSILFLVLAAVLIVPRLLVLAVDGIRWLNGISIWIPLGINVALVTVPITLIGVNMSAFIKRIEGDGKKHQGSETHEIFAWILVPLLIAAWLMAAWYWALLTPTSDLPAAKLFTQLDGQRLFGWPTWIWWGIWLGLAYSAPWVVGWLTGAFDSISAKEKASRIRPGAVAGWALVAGPLNGILGWCIANLLQKFLETRGFSWHAMAWAPPLILVAMTLVATLHVGLMGTAFQDQRREWWSRAGGQLLTFSLAWSVFFGIAFYGPLLLAWMGQKLAAAGGVAWLAATLFGVFTGKSSSTSGREKSNWKSVAATVAPYVFVLGLLLLISCGVHYVLATVNGESDYARLMVRASSQPENFRNAATVAHWQIMHASNSWHLLWIFAVCLGVAVVMAWRVDINEFSMHLFYRNRLARCYLGASRIKPPRQPNRFTGFDPFDDLFLKDLAADAPPDKNQGPNTEKFDGPLPIINTALNLVSGEQLAWQNRKAQSFIFTPRYSGFEPADNQGMEPDEEHRKAYRPTSHVAYELGPFLGTAFAISGAAASPNMGYHSSPVLAFLLTVFNVRLGWWLGNPKSEATWKKPGPKFGLFYLVNELLGRTNDSSDYVYLSDGGHFENLGLYELVRRRCRLIVVCDAGADPEYHFEDLGGAVEKCRVDFGAEITICTTPLARTGDPPRNQQHCVVGQIKYQNGEIGTLVYLKTSLTGDEPSDVLHYASAHTDFPQQPTADQFFEEDQFESYRALGLHVGLVTFGGAQAGLARLESGELASELTALWAGSHNA